MAPERRLVGLQPALRPDKSTVARGRSRRLRGLAIALWRFIAGAPLTYIWLVALMITWNIQQHLTDKQLHDLLLHRSTNIHALGTDPLHLLFPACCGSTPRTLNRTWCRSLACCRSPRSSSGSVSTCWPASAAVRSGTQRSSKPSSDHPGRARHQSQGGKRH
jgi:hypothetical protein